MLHKVKVLILLYVTEKLVKEEIYKYLSSRYIRDIKVIKSCKVSKLIIKIY